MAYLGKTYTKRNFNGYGWTMASKSTVINMDELERKREKFSVELQRSLKNWISRRERTIFELRHLAERSESKHRDTSILKLAGESLELF